MTPSPNDKSGLPLGIMTKKWILPFEKIHKLFAKTNYGHILRNRIRWGLYRPPEYSNKEWEKILGPDANNLDHLLIAFNITRDFLRVEKSFSQREKELLLFTAIVHDWAEPVVGDTMNYLKTKQDNIKEIKLLKNVLKELFGEDLDRTLINKVNDILINKKKSRLGRAFNAIEEMGYFQTGFIAWEKSKKANGDLKSRLQWLMSAVLMGDIEGLINHAAEFKSVREYLVDNKVSISEAFDRIPVEVFKLHRYGTHNLFKKKFEKAKKTWLKYNKKL